MSLNQQIITALAPVGLPVRPHWDTGQLERCITFQYNLIPAHFAGNRPLCRRALIQVHLFLPLGENGLETRRALAAALAAGGFDWPEEVDASDGEGQHFVFETGIYLWFVCLFQSTSPQGGTTGL